MSLSASGRTVDETVSQSVVEAVADAEDVAPEDLAPPLYEVIDPDALGRLFTSTGSSSRSSGRVDFTYIGHHVTVRGDGTVSVDETDGPA